MRRIAPTIACLAVLLARCGETSTIRPHATAYVRILSVDGERVVDHIVTRPSQLQGSVP